ncbi:MAG: hypothetical protein LBR38_03970 [Synergistaceae bacterium]|nr:hypothetical protein [Synergistaceae bacterium]
MSGSRKYKSGAMASIHKTAEALYTAGAIGRDAMLEFDEACLEREGLPRAPGRLKVRHPLANTKVV